jgi:hypothetical protein
MSWLTTMTKARDEVLYLLRSGRRRWGNVELSQMNIVRQQFQVVRKVKAKGNGLRNPDADEEVWAKGVVIEYKRTCSSPDYAFLYKQPARDAFLTRSDASGRFQIDRLPADAGAFLAAQKGDKVSPDFDRSITINQMPQFAGQKDIELKLIPRAVTMASQRTKPRPKTTLLIFTGIVRDAAGNPLEGVRLRTCPALQGTNYNPSAQPDAHRFGAKLSWVVNGWFWESP